MIIGTFSFYTFPDFSSRNGVKIKVSVNHSVNRCTTFKAMSIKVSVICFKSKVLSNGEHPLMLRITESKKRVMKSLGISVI